jgi:hypothetical protein
VCEESLETRKVGVISDKYTSRKIPLKEVKVIQMLKFPWRFFLTVGSGAVAVANKVGRGWQHCHFLVTHFPPNCKFSQQSTYDFHTVGSAPFGTGALSSEYHIDRVGDNSIWFL